MVTISRVLSPSLIMRQVILGLDSMSSAHEMPVPIAAQSITVPIALAIAPLLLVIDHCFEPVQDGPVHVVRGAVVAAQEDRHDVAGMLSVETLPEIGQRVLDELLVPGWGHQEHGPVQGLDDVHSALVGHGDDLLEDRKSVV